MPDVIGETDFGHRTSPDFDAHLVEEPDHAIVFVTGRAGAEQGAPLKAALAEAEHLDHGNIIVDLRHVSALGDDALRALLWELGRAVDSGRSLRLVVTDPRYLRAISHLGMNGTMPIHPTVTEARRAGPVRSGAHIRRTAVPLPGQGTAPR